MACVVTIEGITKSGKTTQCRLTKTSLEKQRKRTITIPEFASSAIGRLAEDLAFNRLVASPHATFLIFVANDWEKSEYAHRIQEAYDVVIIDGFIEHVLAYESVSLDLSLNKNSIERLYSYFDGLPLVPDLNIILHPSLSEVIDRLENCSPQKLNHFKKAYRNFELLIEHLRGKSRYKTIYIENMEPNQITSKILDSIKYADTI